MRFLDANFAALRSCYPDLAARLEADPASRRVDVRDAPDGGLVYTVDDGGCGRAITEPHTPLTPIREQICRNTARLADLSRPVFVVGLYPGSELMFTFENGRRAPQPHPDQTVYVCIDSLPCLKGFLQAFDAADMIRSDRLRMFWHEDTADIVGALEADPTLPYIFTLISAAGNGILDRVMPPLAGLVASRKQERTKLLAENNAYYDAISDSQLEATIAKSSTEKRAPRLMIPTNAWSQVVQYSSRDVAAEFTKHGWDVRCICVEGMLTSYYMAREINDFKPDVFLFINHLRTETPDAYPKNMMFVTWVQDTISSINNRAAAEEWNEYARGRNRDLIIGYTEQLTRYGYSEDRLRHVPMIVNPDTFHPSAAPAERNQRFDCDLCFASNRSTTPGRAVEDQVIPQLARYGLLPEVIRSIHDRLWQACREERTFTTYPLLETELRDVRDFRRVYDELPDDARDHVLQVMFWKLNDVIYRHVVLEWCDELGVNMHIYGEGWQDHPRFGKYARGTLAHGEELSAAYGAARICLHLNSAERTHQRIAEIVASGGTVLTRSTTSLHGSSLNAAFREIARRIPGPAIRPENAGGRLPENERRALTNWVFSAAHEQAHQCDHSQTPSPRRLTKVLLDMFLAGARAGPGTTGVLTFRSRSDLQAILASPADTKLRPDTPPASTRQEHVTVIGDAILRMLNPEPSAQEITFAEVLEDAIGIGIADVADLAGLAALDGTWQDSRAKCMHACLNGIDPALLVCDIALPMIRAGRFNEARTEMEHLLHRLPPVASSARKLTGETALLTALACSRTGLLDQARAILHGVEVDRLDSADSRDLFATLLTATGLCDMSLATLASSESIGETGEQHFYRKALALESLGQYAAAGNALEDDLARNGPRWQNSCRRAALCIRTGNTAPAESLLSGVISQHRGNSNAEMTANHTLAMMRRATGAIDAAMKFHGKAEIPGDNPWAWAAYLEHARLLRYVGRCQEALETASKGIAVSDEPCNLCINYAAILNGDYDASAPAHWAEVAGASFRPWEPYESIGYLWAAAGYRRFFDEKRAKAVLPTRFDGATTPAAMAGALYPSQIPDLLEIRILASELDLISSGKTGIPDSQPITQ